MANPFSVVSPTTELPVWTVDGSGNTIQSGTATVAGGIIAPWVQTTGQYNVATFGAGGDGVTDVIRPLQAAVDMASAAGGGVVNLNPGIYRTSDVLTMKKNVWLRGPMGTSWPGRFPTPVCAIKPLSTFAGECAVSMLGADITGGSGNQGNMIISDLDLDGSALPAGSVSGLHAQGEVMGVTLMRMAVKQFTHNGLHTNIGSGTRAPHDWFVDTVVTFQNSGFGFSMSMTDGYFRDCIASTNGGDGWLMGPFGSMAYVGCQALFNGGNGLTIAGGSQVGNLVVTDFVTDRNNFDGIHIGPSAGAGSPVFQFSGITCNRDGKNSNGGGGSFAGFKANGCANPVLINGLITNTGLDDDGSGVNSPQYGAYFSGNAAVVVNGAYVHGNTEGWHDIGDNTLLIRGLDVLEATGSKTAPVLVYTNGVGTPNNNVAIRTVGRGLMVAEGANAKMGTAVLVGGAATVATTAVTATSRILLTSQVDGGTPGFLRVDTRTAGTSFHIQSSAAGDTSTVAWFIVEPA